MKTFERKVENSSQRCLKMWTSYGPLYNDLLVVKEMVLYGLANPLYQNLVLSILVEEPKIQTIEIEERHKPHGSLRIN